MVCDANNLKSKNYNPYDMLKHCYKWCMDNTLWGVGLISKYRTRLIQVLYLTWDYHSTPSVVFSIHHEWIVLWLINCFTLGGLSVAVVMDSCNLVLSNLRECYFSESYYPNNARWSMLNTEHLNVISMEYGVSHLEYLILFPTRLTCFYANSAGCVGICNLSYFSALQQSDQLNNKLIVPYNI